MFLCPFEIYRLRTESIFGNIIPFVIQGVKKTPSMEKDVILGRMVSESGKRFDISVEIRVGREAHFFS